MAAVDVLGLVSDRLVGGMMFHSDMADLCRYMGFERLAKLHERGFEDDSSAYRKVHRLCVRRTGMLVPSGRQERDRYLDQHRAKRRTDVTDDARADALKDAMARWAEWEEGTGDVFRSAARRLLDMGEMALSERVTKLADDTESELAELNDLRCRLSATGWDATLS